MVFVGTLVGAAVAIGAEAEPPPQAIREINKAKAAPRLYSDQCPVGSLGIIITVSLLAAAGID